MRFLHTRKNPLEKQNIKTQFKMRWQKITNHKKTNNSKLRLAEGRFTIVCT